MIQTVTAMPGKRLVLLRIWYLAGGTSLLGYPPRVSCYINTFNHVLCGTTMENVHDKPMCKFSLLGWRTAFTCVFIVCLADLHQTWPTLGRRRCTKKGCGISESTISNGAIQSASQTGLRRFQKSIPGELSKTALAWFIQMRFCMQLCQV